MGLIVLMMGVKCFVTWRKARSHDLALREMDVIRENQIRLSSQLAQTQSEVLRSEERTSGADVFLVGTA